MSTVADENPGHAIVPYDASLMENEKPIMIMKALDSTREAIGIFDPAGGLIYQNRAFSEIFEFETPGEMQAVGGGHAIVREKETAKEIFGRAMGGKSWAGELAMVTKSGRVFPAFIRADAIKDDHGSIVGIICVVSDGTKRKQLAQSLRASKIRGCNLFNQTFQFAAIVAINGRLTAANQTSLDFIGAHESDVIGKPFQETPWWDHSVELKEWLCEAVSRVATGAFVQREVSHVSTRGDLHYFDFSLKPVVDENGKVLYLIAESRDVTERKRAEEALLESAQKYRSLYKGVQIGFFRTRLADGLLIETNQRLVEMLGYDFIDELVERLSAADFYADSKTRAHVISALKENGDLRDYETRFRRKDGSILWARLSGALCQEGMFFVGTIADITESKQAEAETARLEAQCRQARKVAALGRLAGGVAHDLNNLLTPILGYGEMLQGLFDLDDRRRRYADQIVRAGYRVRNLVRQLLALGRKQTLAYRPIDLNKTLEEFSTLLQHTIREDIALEIIPGTGIPTVKADIGQIEQVIMTLSVMAQDTMSGGGRLTLKTAMAEIDEAMAAGLPTMQAGRYAMLAIIDTGSGMDEKSLEQISEPFFYTQSEQGTGLGLATVYGIVKQHGGRIRAESEPGKGTAFYIYLPELKAAQAGNRILEKPTGDLRGSETILVAQDNEPVRDVGHAVFTKQGSN